MGYLPRQCSGRISRSAMRSTSTQLCGQPRRWITSAGLSPVALAPMGGHQMTPKYYTVMSRFAQTSAVDRKTLAAGGARGWSAPMTKADEFREYAGEALRWSCQSSTEEEKKALIGLAVTWTQAASLSEMKSVGPPRA